jgi:hypothetical protein
LLPGNTVEDTTEIEPAALKTAVAKIACFRTMRALWRVHDYVWTNVIWVDRYANPAINKENPSRLSITNDMRVFTRVL